jgi:hypothetical protein
MYCFLSGKLNATPDSLDKFDVPISEEMQGTEIASYFKRNNKVKYAEKYIIYPLVLQPEKRMCDFSGQEY